MKMTGELLKAERLKQDLKTTDIAFALKLSAKVIKNIEDGEIESLPAKTFVRGFVKSYAEFLKLDAAAVLKQFQEEMGSTSPVIKAPPLLSPQQSAGDSEAKEPAAVVPQIKENMNPGLTQNHVVVFASVTLIVVTLALVNHFMKKYTKEKTAVTEMSTTSLPPVNSIASSADQKLANLQAMNKTVPISADATTPIDVNNETKNSLTNQTELSEKNVATVYAPLSKSNGKPVEVLIAAKKDITVEYAKGSSTLFEKVAVKENTYQIIRSQNGLHIRGADGSQFVMTVNGIVQPPTKNKPFQITF